MNFSPVGLASKLAWDIGTRTSFRLATHYPHVTAMQAPWRVVTPSLRLREGTPIASTLLLYCHMPWQGVCLQYATNLSAGPPVLVSPPLIGAMIALQRAHGGKRRALISSGLAALAVAMAMCTSVHVYGFGNASDSSQAGECWRYWDCRHNQSRFLNGKHGGAGSMHDWRAQWRTIEALVSTRALLYHGASVRDPRLVAAKATRAAKMLSHMAPIASHVERYYVGGRSSGGSPV